MKKKKRKKNDVMFNNTYRKKSKDGCAEIPSTRGYYSKNSTVTSWTSSSTITNTDFGRKI